MKIFCNCNSSWIVGLGYTYSGTNPQIQLNTTPSCRSTKWCNKCTYWFWYDAHYENMMFDLKRMNEV